MSRAAQWLESSYGLRFREGSEPGTDEVRRWLHQIEGRAPEELEWDAAVAPPGEDDSIPPRWLS